MAESGKPMTKTEIMNTLADQTGLTKKQIGCVLEELKALLAANLGADGPGVFNLPGLLKITVQHKPATPERPGVNPFTGEPTVFKAKPACNVVKIRPLKGLKELV